MRYASISIVLLCGFSVSASADWADLWRTPEQRAADSFKAGDHEALLEHAPDDNWTGLGQFQSGDYDTASQTFREQAINEQVNGNSAAVNRALYNQGVSDVMAGRYQEALTSFDKVLAEDPEFSDAAHNREIAQKLVELQQQQQQQQQSQEGDQDEQSQEGEEGERSQEGEEGEQSQEGEEGEQSQQGEQGDKADKSQQEQNQQSDESSNKDDQSQQQSETGSEGATEDDLDDSESQSDDEQAAEQARQALAAEARLGEEQEESDAEQSETMGAEMEERPLSESEQATEQWLRRIPDDPAGLLRRKLEQSHRNEFPEVRDAVEPW